MTKEEQSAATKAAIEKIQELNEKNGGYCIRFGEALPLKEPKAVSIDGTIDAPARWVEKRKDGIAQTDAHVLVDRDKMSITLNIDENSAYSDQVTGTLTLSSEMQEFGINTGEYMSCFDMSDRIKQLRSYFETQQEAMKLVSELRNFKAKIDKELELSDDKRGNQRILKSQFVESNLPKDFKIQLPIFKGMRKETIQVEVEINPNDLSCTLVSPEAHDIVVQQRDMHMDAVIDRIKDAAPTIVIIEQ
jgi:hypothetical protein|nr:MAG TPA: protein of unknown function DUF2303 [Caudoviricetes sp.]